MTNAGDAALARSQEFAKEITDLVCGVMHGESEFQAMKLGKHVTVSTFDDQQRIRDIPLYIRGERVASWRYTMALSLDKYGDHLKVIRSNFSLTSIVDKTPLVRYEFDDAMRTAPIAHWQFHGERGAFSHLLGIAQGKGAGSVKPHSLSSLHFPVGGGRMRAGLEDLLEFLIRECHFDCRGGWNGALRESRKKFRIIQARTLARDAPIEVADVLTKMGWTVTPPSPAPGPATQEALFKW